MGQNRSIPAHAPSMPPKDLDRQVRLEAESATPGPANCTPKYTAKPCTTCTLKELRAALINCLPTQFAHTVRHRGSGTPAVRYRPRDEGVFGLGNHLGQYFHSAGIARIARVDFRGSFSVSGLRLSHGFDAPRGGPDYRGAALLAHYCWACNRQKVALFPHVCRGPWLYADIRGELERSLRAARVQPEAKDVVVQFRCSDSYFRRGYGALRWAYYRTALAEAFAGQAPRDRTVTIITDPGVPTEPFCRALLRVLVGFVRRAFPRCGVEVQGPRPLVQDLGTMVRAQVFLAHVSSLGFWAGLARRGPTYMPVAMQMGGLSPVCFEHVRWLGGVRQRRPAFPTEGPAALRRIGQWFAPGQELLVDEILSKKEEMQPQ